MYIAACVACEVQTCCRCALHRSVDISAIGRIGIARCQGACTADIGNCSTACIYPTLADARGCGQGIACRVSEADTAGIVNSCIAAIRHRGAACCHCGFVCAVHKGAAARGQRVALACRVARCICLSHAHTTVVHCGVACLHTAVFAKIHIFGKFNHKSAIRCVCHHTDVVVAQFADICAAFHCQRITKVSVYIAACVACEVKAFAAHAGNRIVHIACVRSFVGIRCIRDVTRTCHVVQACTAAHRAEAAICIFGDRCSCAACKGHVVQVRLARIRRVCVVFHCKRICRCLCVLDQFYLFFGCCTACCCKARICQGFVAQSF